jgi:hypothetical protein
MAQEKFTEWWWIPMVENILGGEPADLEAALRHKKLCDCAF